MKETNKLLGLDPFDFSREAKNQFVKSFNEIASHHYNNHTYTKFLWDKKQLNPNDIASEEDLSAAPFMLVNEFKENDFKTTDDIILTLGSSGTSGQRSVMHLNQYSLDNVKKLAFNIYDSLNIVSDKKYNYLCFTYDPKVADDLGTAFTDELLTSFTGIEEIYYTFQFDEIKNDFVMDEEKIVSVLKRFETSEHSTRILGFPAFLYEILQKYDLKLDLGNDSWLQTGGGWKSKADKEIPKQEFRQLIENRLGIPKENIRDLFGMVEHGIPYVDCQNGKLRIPNYSRVYIRDPYTLELLEDGEVGLIQFMCTYNTAYPSINILTTDWGRIVKEADGISEYSLEIVGRAGLNKNKGCALKALDLLKD